MNSPGTRRAPGEILYPVAEVAELWRCSADTIGRLIARGKLRAVNIGDGRAKLRVPASALAEYVARHGVA